MGDLDLGVQNLKINRGLGKVMYKACAKAEGKIFLKNNFPLHNYGMCIM
jgi:hypothetical protein